MGLSSIGSASVIAFDNASDAAYNSDWTTGSNGGTGWGGGWTVVQPGEPTFTGHYVGSSANNGGSPNINTSGSKSWAMYANTSNLAEASRSFSGDLSVGQKFVIDFDNGDVASGMSVGFGLRDAGSNNKLEFFFAGGNATYSYSDSTGGHDSLIPWTDGGLHLEMTLTGTNTYSLFIQRLANNQTTTVTGTLAGTAGSGVRIFRGFDFNPSTGGGTRDIFFNSMAVTPEPASLGLLGLVGLGMLRRRTR